MATHEIAAGGTVLRVDSGGVWRALVFGGEEIVLPGLAPRVVLAGKPARIRSVSESDGGLALELSAEGRAGVWRLMPAGDAIRSTVRIEGGDRRDAVRFELPFPPPPAGRLHVPTARGHGSVIDEASPFGRENGIPCVFRPPQFLAATVGERAISLIGRSSYAVMPHGSWGPAIKSGGYREDDALWAQFEVMNGEALGLAVDGSLDAAVRRYHTGLRRDYGARPWREPGATPDWFEGTRMVVTLDMMRSTGEIAHSYAHLRDLCRRMKAAGIGPGVLFYFPGYHARYDAEFPLYGPCDALGGAAGFREMIAAVHDAGHRVMLHAMVWGADPCHPFFEQVEHLAADPETMAGRPGFPYHGPYVGWPGCHPPQKLDFDSGAVPMNAEPTGGAVVFRTVSVPREVAAHLSISGVRGLGAGRLRVLLHGRELLSRPGELAADGSCRFRFRLRFEPGVNEVRLESVGGEGDLSGASYRIAEGVYSGPGDVWTHPIIRMDTTNPEWIAVLRARLAGPVNEFGVDAVHLDADNICALPSAPIHEALRDAMPGALFGCEFSAELGHSLFHVSQGGSIPEPGPHRVSDLGWQLHEPYMKLYYHLCRAEGFVPVGKVCDHAPVADELSDDVRERAERQFAEARKWHMLPNIRLNYRDYGLDPRTQAAFEEVLG